MRRLLLFAFTLSIFLISGAQSAQASGPEGFRWEVGTGTVCGVEPTACPDITKASNGDTITVRAAGNLDVEDGEASGGGTFEHRTSSGALLGSGTLKAKRLLGFTFYGCDTSPQFGPNFCGGLATIRVKLVGHPASNPSATIRADGILVVTCLFGNPPLDALEGFTLNVKHINNFDTPVIGDTLFIPKSED